MKGSSDILVKKLNMVSNSYFWPNYYISKHSSTIRLRQVSPVNNDIITKVKSLAKKRIKCSPVSQKDYKSASTQRRKLFVIPTKPRTHTCNNTFFNDDHIKVLRMVPNDKIMMKSIKKSAKPLITRDSLYEDSRYRVKPSTTQTIEIQTSLTKL